MGITSRIFRIIPSTVGFAAGLTMWHIAAVSCIYRIFILIVDRKFEVFYVYDLLSNNHLTWVYNNFGSLGIWFFKLDITAPLSIIGFIFIIFGFLAKKVLDKQPEKPVAEIFQG